MIYITGLVLRCVYQKTNTEMVEIQEAFITPNKEYIFLAGAKLEL